MPQLEQSPDAVVLAEWCAPGLEEWLRRDHEDFHGLICGIVRKEVRKVNVSLAIYAS
jgi:hypothetical protein